MTSPLDPAAVLPRACKCGCGEIPPMDSKGRKPLGYVKEHRDLLLRRKAAEDFWTKVDIRRPDECWPWKGSIRKNGYGTVSWRNRTFVAYKVAYILAIGPVPDGLHLDHACHKRGDGCPGGRDCTHRRCCNPSHLRAIPLVENVMQGMAFSALNSLKEECINGHPFNEANTYIRKEGGRDCRECRRLRWHERQKRRGQAREQGTAAA